MPRAAGVDATVYVVEQDEAIRDSLRLLLELHDLHVVTFASFEDFRRDGRADGLVCALIDLRTAGMCGTRLLRALDEVSFLAPVIMMSAEHDPDRGFPPGRDAVTLLRKPFSVSDLFNAIRQVLEIGPPH